MAVTEGEKYPRPIKRKAFSMKAEAKKEEEEEEEEGRGRRGNVAWHQAT